MKNNSDSQSRLYRDLAIIAVVGTIGVVGLGSAIYYLHSYQQAKTETTGAAGSKGR